MNARWLGCLVVACTASLARADAPAVDDKALDKAAAPKTGAIIKAATVRPDEAPVDPGTRRPRPTAKPTAKVAAQRADEELRALTNDPVLGKADRISGEEVKGMVTFTFDDGPDPQTTPAVIAALQKYDVPATFFVVTRRLVGKLGADGRALLRRQLEAGFDIASHSVSHKNLRFGGKQRLADEIDQSIRTLARESERTIGLFRAPFGALNKDGRAWLKKRGLTEAFWSIDTLDWQAKHAERLRAKVMQMIVKQDGGVVLMHDVKPITAEVIGLILDDLEAENCRRLAAKQPPILPVSIHYFLRDNKQPRAIPDAVQKRTEAYRLALPLRCAARGKPAEPAPAASSAMAAPAATAGAPPIRATPAPATPPARTAPAAPAARTAPPAASAAPAPPAASGTLPPKP